MCWSKIGTMVKKLDWQVLIAANGVNCKLDNEENTDDQFLVTNEEEKSYLKLMCII